MNAPALPDVRRSLFAAQDWYAGLVADVTDDQLDRPTPCTEFDVRRLMSHMVAVFDKIVGLAADRVDPYAGSQESPDQAIERLAADEIDGRTPAERSRALADRAARAREAWTDEALEADITLGWGPVMPGRVVTAIYLMEVLAHGWDLASATGLPGEAPSEVAQAGLAAARAGLPESPRGVEHGVPFGPVVASADDAGPTEQLANWTGRHTRPARRD